MALTIFDILNEICLHKSDLDFDDPEISKAYDIYMINRYISMIEILVRIVDAVNMSGIDKRDHYNFLRAIVPKNNYRFSYIKKTVDKELEEDLRNICRFFEVGMRDARHYAELLKPKQLEELRKIYRYGKHGKQIPQFT